jgi:hypothetical protein
VLWNRNWNRNRRNGNILPKRNRNQNQSALWFRFQKRISESNIKCNEKVKKSKREASFLGNNAAADIEKARFCRILLLLESCDKFSGSGTRTGAVAGTGTKTF